MKSPLMVQIKSKDMTFLGISHSKAQLIYPLLRFYCFLFEFFQ